MVFVQSLLTIELLLPQFLGKLEFFNEDTVLKLFSLFEWSPIKFLSEKNVRLL